MYFIVNREYGAIMGVTDVMYTSFTNTFVEVTEEQVTQYEAIQSTLPPDTYVELKDIIQPKKIKTQIEDKPTRQATPEQRAAMAEFVRRAKYGPRKTKTTYYK